MDLVRLLEADQPLAQVLHLLEEECLEVLQLQMRLRLEVWHKTLDQRLLEL